MQLDNKLINLGIMTGVVVRVLMADQLIGVEQRSPDLRFCSREDRYVSDYRHKFLQDLGIDPEQVPDSPILCDAAVIIVFLLLLR